MSGGLDSLLETLGWAQWIVLLVALQRLAELALARRNARALLAAGAQEHGHGHYPAIVALHAAWLAALFLAVPPGQAPDWPWLAAFVLLQAGRAWAIAALGRRWTTRVIVLPGAPLVRVGPYRFMRHPNYAVVALEIVILPLAFGAFGLAAAFGVANAALLAWRIRIEDAALREALRGSIGAAPPA
ncbi:MAG: hypothetical protein JNK11_14190 [Alphaproteobacteria bacterium]|nr:hypothetical protein [Alphaproteobacteria bacterium]